MSISAFLKDKLIESTLLNRELFPALYLSLHNGDPGEWGDNEITGSDFARVPFQAKRGAPGAILNADTMESVAMPEGVITHFGVWNEATGGEFLLGDELAQPMTVLPEQNRRLSLRFGAGDLLLRIG